LIEPVFGIIKSAIGFTRFHLRGLANVTAEWLLVTVALQLPPAAPAAARLSLPSPLLGPLRPATAGYRRPDTSSPQTQTRQAARR
jgi:hypothetical protein